MGSIERRISRLEELYGMDEDPDSEARDRRTEEIRAEILARLEHISAQADYEEGEEMDPRRRRALEDFFESVRRRRERGA
jgi:hypothetical protein